MMSTGNNNDRLNALLGTELPIIQSPMAGVQDSALTIAVCEAGGLGSLPCAMLSIEKMVSEIAAIKQATVKPYNLNFFCHELSAYNPQQHAAWQATLEPYFTELGIDCDTSPVAASRQPFNHDIADAIEPLHPEIISFHFGLPEETLLQRVKGWGTKIIASATTLEEALWLEAKEVDGIIAQGVEAGGHRGMFLSKDITTQVGMFSLVAQISNSVKLPVIAAGGIADHKGVQAALTLGASAVQIGTSYLLCDEATTSPLHRAALSSTAAQHTALTNVFSGRPARGIVNRVMKELEYMHSAAPDFPSAAIEITQLRSAAEKQNAHDFTSLWSGQNTSGCREISAGELTKTLVTSL